MEKYLTDYYNNIVKRARPKHFNLLEAYMGSGKSTFIKKYATDHPDKTCVMVFFKNGKEDFKDSNIPNLETSYYTDWMKKIIEEKESELNNYVVFADEYDYLQSIMEATIREITHNKDGTEKTVNVAKYAPKQFQDLVDKLRGFLDTIRQNCQYLYLISATKIDDSRYYTYGNKKEVNLLTEEESSTLKRVKIESVTNILRRTGVGRAESIKRFLEKNKGSYDKIYAYQDKVDKAFLSDIAKASQDLKKIAIIPHWKLDVMLKETLSKYGWDWCEDQQRLTEENHAFSDYDIAFLNQTSNRGVNITKGDQRVLVLCCGTVNANKLQVAGRFRNNSCKVDVVYFNTYTQEECRHLDIESYKPYCGKFDRIIHKESIKKPTQQQLKREAVATYYNPELSDRKNAEKITEESGLKVSYALVRSYRLEQAS